MSHFTNVTLSAVLLTMFCISILLANTYYAIDTHAPPPPDVLYYYSNIMPQPRLAQVGVLPICSARAGIVFHGELPVTLTATNVQQHHQPR